MEKAAVRNWAGMPRRPKEEAELRMSGMAPGERDGTLKVPFQNIEREAYLVNIRGKGIAARAHKAPMGKVALAHLTGIQSSVNRERLQAHLADPDLIPKGTRGSGHGMPIDLPVVVKYKGAHYLHDGHHRATAAFVRGDDSVIARIVDLDEPGS